ncbi:MAG: hypothetical protein GY874_10810 [Desulfobacteraceae bacterium]|nr:hypothetical protein [Desulfobacteraceae bacterium]
MPLTMEEKEKYSALFELYSGYKYPSYKWNENAVEALLEMISKLQDCTIGIGSLTTVIPQAKEIILGVKGLEDWAKRVPIDILKITVLTNKHIIVSKLCSNFGLKMLTDTVRVKLME